MELQSQHQCHGGTVSTYSHFSEITQCDMRFSLFMPPQAHPETNAPYLMFLSGLTCTEENFTTKACAYQKAAELGLAILAPDTSPRGENVPNDDAYDLGQGAGFYLDATESPWNSHFKMESYLLKDLLPLVEKHFPLSASKVGISGHSMGGHGALTLYLKYPEKFTSCSAFAPIVAPSQVPWGKKAFSAYLGDNQELWKQHDACELLRSADASLREREILIDQGLADNFYDEQLKTPLFQELCSELGQANCIRLQTGYDHSYFFIQSFIDSHLDWHARRLV